MIGYFLQGPTEIKSLPEPKELKFHVDQHILDGIETAKTGFNKNVRIVQL